MLGSKYRQWQNKVCLYYENIFGGKLYFTTQSIIDPDIYTTTDIHNFHF